MHSPLYKIVPFVIIISLLIMDLGYISPVAANKGSRSLLLWSLLSRHKN